MNKIINGNSIEEMNNMEPNCVDLIFADPPYWMRVEGTLLRVEGTEFDGCDDAWDQFETLEDYENFTRKWLAACYRVLKPNGSIWVIGSMQCIYTIGSIMQELGFWLICIVHKSHRKCLKESLLFLLKSATLYSDPFGGTMTTAAAAKKLGRNYIMIEREKKYCDFGELRLSQVEFEDTPIARALFDQKPIKVSVPEMIEANALIEGETFYFRDGKPIATLCRDGKLNYNGEIIDIHSCAAIARKVKAKRLNGFAY